MDGKCHLCTGPLSNINLKFACALLFRCIMSLQHGPLNRGGRGLRGLQDEYDRYNISGPTNFVKNIRGLTGNIAPYKKYLKNKNKKKYLKKNEKKKLVLLCSDTQNYQHFLNF